MGYMRHHAIVVTALDDWLAPAQDAATIVGCVVTPITASRANGYASFLVVPDGSKEGWDTSTAGDRARAEFVEWLRGQAYRDGSNRFDWVEVQFGDDDNEARILNCGDWDYVAHSEGRDRHV